MTDRLGMLSNLHSLHLTNCSLSHFPNLENIPDLYNVDFSHNPLSEINRFNNVFYLVLDNCRFTELPRLTNPSRLGNLSMSNNSLKHVAKIASFINLRSLDLNNSTLSSIPPTIDRLEKLARLSLSHNRLSSLPMNILKVSSLIYVDLSNNSFPAMELDSIHQQFLTRLPNTTLVIWEEIRREFFFLLVWLVDRHGYDYIDAAPHSLPWCRHTESSRTVGNESSLLRLSLGESNSTRNLLELEKKDISLSSLDWRLSFPAAFLHDEEISTDDEITRRKVQWIESFFFLSRIREEKDARAL